MQLSMEFRFAAAHRLPYYDGPCFRMHGHNYKLVVTIGGKVDPKSGMIMDFMQLKSIVQEQVLDHCDHKCLNDFMDNPTAEHIAVWCWERLRPRLPGLAEVKVYEIDDACVTYRGPEAP